MEDSHNLTWQSTTVGKQDRRQRNGHESFVLWFTGLSGAGKSTIANLLEQVLFAQGIHTYLLDGDNVRMGLNSDLGFSATERRENIRRVAEVAKLFVDAGVVTLTAFISPYQSDREMARSLFTDTEFVEVYVDCPIEVCATRDPKGLYLRAQSGQIKEFTGVAAPYETPQQPDIVLHTNLQTPLECVQQILGCLVSWGLLSKDNSLANSLEDTCVTREGQR
ncbi:adenylyl-sulfate kinase [Alicyclobacillaceae bacterium I2511]|jgi:adenylylsulfate kinase|nr:adenylyl-sulfate kinase [Alicyclobacillaceae bacterium I2511]